MVAPFDGDCTVAKEVIPPNFLDVPNKSVYYTYLLTEFVVVSETAPTVLRRGMSGRNSLPAEKVDSSPFDVQRMVLCVLIGHLRGIRIFRTWSSKHPRRSGIISMLHFDLYLLGT